jgi:hypothetical protein
LAAHLQQRRLEFDMGRSWITSREWLHAQNLDAERKGAKKRKTDILLATFEAEAESRRLAEVADAARLRAENEAQLAAAVAARQSEQATLESAIAEESRLRAAWEAARAAVLAQEARVESALAEETRLTALLGPTGPNVTVAAAAHEPKTPLEGRVKAAAAEEPKPSLKGRVKAQDEEADAEEPEAAREKVKAVRFALPDDPEPSLEGRESPVEAEEAHEPEKAEHGEPADEPETAVLESLAEEPIPEVEQGEAEAEDDSVTEEPEPSLKGMVKVDEPTTTAVAAATADEPETPLEGRVKAVAAAAATAADEPEPSLEGTVKAGEPVAEEPEPSLEGREKADTTVADVPEASLERTAADDATATYEPEQKAPSEEEAPVTVATATPAESETESSFGEEVMMTPGRLAEPIPEVEHGEERANEPTLAQEPETAQQTIMLAHEPETAECESLDADESMLDASFEEESAMKAEPFAYEPETAQHTMLAQEPVTVERPDLADEPMPMASYEEGGEVKAEGEFSSENVDPMLVFAQAEAQQEVDYYQMMAEQERLAAIQEQIRVAEAQAALLADLQRAEDQRRAQEEWELAQALALQQAQEEERARAEAEERARQQHEAWQREQAEAAERAREQHEAWLREQAEAAERQRREEEEDASLRDYLVARLAEEDDRLAALAAAETTPAEEASEGAATPFQPEAGETGADLSDSEEDESDTSLNAEDFAWLDCTNDDEMRFDFTAREGQEEDSLFGSASEDDDMPTTTPATADRTPSTIGGVAAQNQVLHLTWPISQTTPLRAEAADAEPAPAGEAEQRLAGPANPAARKLLPARGVRGSKEAKLRPAQELREIEAAREREETLGEDLSPEDLAWCEEAEEEWAAEMAEDEAKSKGKEAAKSRADVRAEARAKAALEFKRIEEARQQSAEKLQLAVESSKSQETPFRPLVLGEEAWFDPRADAAFASASTALAMSVAAEEAQRAARNHEEDETEEEISEEE